MKRKAIFALLAIAFFMASDASALPSLKGTIEVTGGNTYDYVVIGMRPDASDGYDNAFDIMAPTGNMNDTYIKVTINHPEWYALKTEFRSDIRSIRETQEWTLSVYTNLPVGTDLAVALKDAAGMPVEYQLNLKDSEAGTITDLKSAAASFTTTASPMTKSFTIVADGSASATQIPDSGGTVTQPPAESGSGPITTVQPPKSSFIVSGIVKDQNGNPIADAKISMKSRSVKRNVRTHTFVSSNSEGIYRFTNIPPGTYTITASKGGSRLFKYEFNPVSVSVKDADISADIVGGNIKKRR